MPPAPRHWTARDDSLPSVTIGGDPVPIFATAGAMLPVAWTCVALRFWTRLKIRRAVGWDDWAILFAVLFYTVYCAAIVVTTIHVTKRNPYEEVITWNDLVTGVTFLNLSEEFYMLSIMALKISLGIFFHHIANQRWQRIPIYIAIAASTFFCLAMFFFCIFQCGVYSHASQFITRRLLNECVSNGWALGMTYTHAAITMLTDWTFLILPSAIMKSSLMSRSDKLSVMVILMFASVGGVASIIRFLYIDRLAVPKADFFPNAKDIAVWSCVEPGIGIAAGSVITLRPLFRFIFESRRSIRRTRSVPWRDFITIRFETQRPRGLFRLRRRADRSPGSALSPTATETDPITSSLDKSSKVQSWDWDGSDLWRSKVSSPSPTLSRGDVGLQRQKSEFWGHGHGQQSYTQKPLPATPSEEQPGDPPNHIFHQQQRRYQRTDSEREIQYELKRGRKPKQSQRRSGLPLAMFTAGSRDSIESHGSFG